MAIENNYKGKRQAHIYTDMINGGAEIDQHEYRSIFVEKFAPALAGFVKWVLDSAQKKRIRRLYFLARDGYLMYRMAARMVEEFGYSIECRYLSVSRYAVRIAENHLMPDHGISHMCIGGIDVTILKIMSRAGLDPTEGASFIETLGYQGKENEILNRNDLQKLKVVLERNSAFIDRIDEISLQAYASAIGYFRQEGLLDGESYAFVDSGWVGSLQKSIETLMKSCGSEMQAQGFYFGLYDIPCGESRNKYHAYYFDKRHFLLRKVFFSNCLFETVFSSGEGMTIGYEYDSGSGKYRPVKSNQKNPNAFVIQEFEAGVEQFLDDSLMNKKESIGITPKEIYRCFKKVMGRPSLSEAFILGNLLFCDDILESQMQCVAADLSERQIRNLEMVNKLRYLAGNKHIEIHESAWIEGSIVKCGRHIRRNLKHAALYKVVMYIRKCL